MSDDLEIEKMDMVYICQICDKLFSTDAILREHHQSHIVSKPYKCNICLLTFSHPKDLRVHISTHGIDGVSPTENKTNVVNSSTPLESAIDNHTVTESGTSVVSSTVTESGTSVVSSTVTESETSVVVSSTVTESGTSIVASSTATECATSVLSSTVSESANGISIITDSGTSVDGNIPIRNIFDAVGTSKDSGSDIVTTSDVDGSTTVVLGTCDNMEENGMIKIYVEPGTFQTEGTDRTDGGGEDSPWSQLYPLLLGHQSGETGDQQETVQIVVEEVENVEGLVESQALLREIVEASEGIPKEPHYRKLGKMQYQCLICAQVFTQVSHIKAHHVSHTGEKSFRCEDCDTLFTTPSSLRRHYGRFGHGQDRPDKAESLAKCNEEVLKDPSVKKVLESLAFDKDLLNQKNSTSKELLKKVRTDLTKSPETELSEKTPSTAVNMIRENNVTQTQKSFISECGNCEIFGPKNCRIHGYIYKRLSYKCRLCSRYFQKYYDLQKHKMKHFFKVRKPYYKCGICDSEFSKISVYAIHMRSHPLSRPLKPINLKTIVNEVVKKSSSRKFYEEDDRPYKCFVCFKRFKSKTNLKGHCITHQSIKPHICAQCNTAFTTLSSLNRHQFRFSHIGRFYEPSNIIPPKPKTSQTEFMKRSSRRNPFTCKHCDIRFLLKADYQNHYKEVHSEFVCDICNKSFKTESGLENHELKHFKMIYDGGEWKLIPKHKT